MAMAAAAAPRHPRERRGGHLVCAAVAAPWLLLNQLLEALATVGTLLLLPHDRPRRRPLVGALGSALAAPTARAAALALAGVVARIPLILYNGVSLTRRLDEHYEMKEQLGTPSYAHHASVAPDELSGVAVLGQLSLGRSTAAEGSAGGGGIALTTPTTPAAAPVAADAHVGYMYGGGGTTTTTRLATRRQRRHTAAVAAARAIARRRRTCSAVARRRLGPCLVKRLGRAQAHHHAARAASGAARTLPASIAAFDCDGFGCSKAAVVPPRDFLLVAAALPIALLPRRCRSRWRSSARCGPSFAAARADASSLSPTSRPPPSRASARRRVGALAF